MKYKTDMPYSIQNLENVSRGDSIFDGKIELSYHALLDIKEITKKHINEYLDEVFKIIVKDKYLEK